MKSGPWQLSKRRAPSIPVRSDSFPAIAPAIPGRGLITPLREVLRQKSGTASRSLPRAGGEVESDGKARPSTPAPAFMPLRRVAIRGVHGSIIQHRLQVDPWGLESAEEKNNGVKRSTDGASQKPKRRCSTTGGTNQRTFKCGNESNLVPLSPENLGFFFGLTLRKPKGL